MNDFTKGYCIIKPLFCVAFLYHCIFDVKSVFNRDHFCICIANVSSTKSVCCVSMLEADGSLVDSRS